MKLKTKHLILSSMLTIAMAVTALSGGIKTAYATDGNGDSSPTGGIKIDITAVDIDNSSLTVNVNEGSKKYLDSVIAQSPDANVVYDLYKVASLKENDIKNGDSDSYKTFFFEVNDEFKNLVQFSQGDDLETRIKNAKDQKDYMELAKQCLGLMFGDEGATVKKLASGTEYELDKLQNIEPGMYLLVARGNDKCTTTLKKVAGGSKNTEKGSTLEDVLEESFATNIEINGTEFICSPILFTLPYKDVENASVNDENEWKFDRNLTLKMEAKRETGSIYIDKNLVGYSEGEEDATCVFRVTVYVSEENRTQLSDRVYALKFTKEGKESLRVDGIPYGSYVVVTEEYSGGAYVVDKVTDSAVLVKDVEQRFTFTNTNTGDKGGGGLVNYFSYKKAPDEDKITWTLNGDNVLSDDAKEDKGLDNGDTQNGTPNEK